MLVNMETKYSVGDTVSMLSLGHRIPCTVTDISIRIDSKGYEISYELKTVRKYKMPLSEDKDYYTYGMVEEGELENYQD